MPKAAHSNHTNQRLLERVEIVKAAVSLDMEATQRKYKEDYDQQVHQEQNLSVGDEVYIDRSHHAPFASDIAEELAGKEYKKLMRGMCRLCKVREVKTHTVVIKEVSTDSN